MSGRVLSVPLSKVNEIAKLVPEDLNITLEKALEKDPELLHACMNNDEDAHASLISARKLEGSIRNTGIHAAGIIISGEPSDRIIFRSAMPKIPICRSRSIR